MSSSAPRPIPVSERVPSEMSSRDANRDESSRAVRAAARTRGSRWGAARVVRRPSSDRRRLGFRCSDELLLGADGSSLRCTRTRSQLPRRPGGHDRRPAKFRLAYSPARRRTCRQRIRRALSGAPEDAVLNHPRRKPRSAERMVGQRPSRARARLEHPNTDRRWWAPVVVVRGERGCSGPGARPDADARAGASVRRSVRGRRQRPPAGGAIHTDAVGVRHPCGRPSRRISGHRRPLDPAAGVHLAGSSRRRGELRCHDRRGRRRRHGARGKFVGHGRRPRGSGRGVRLHPLRNDLVSRGEADRVGRRDRGSVRKCDRDLARRKHRADRRPGASERRRGVRVQPVGQRVGPAGRADSARRRQCGRSVRLVCGDRRGHRAGVKSVAAGGCGRRRWWRLCVHRRRHGVDADGNARERRSARQLRSVRVAVGVRRHGTRGRSHTVRSTCDRRRHRLCVRVFQKRRQLVSASEAER